jgi:type I restriction enzyme M protein
LYKVRASQILFIEARFLGRMISRRNRELTDDDIAAVAGLYHNWRDSNSQYKDIPGFCKSVQQRDIIAQEYLLTPSRYVGIDRAAEKEDEDGIFEEKIKQLANEFTILIERGAELDREIMENLRNVGSRSIFQ